MSLTELKRAVKELILVNAVRLREEAAWDRPINALFQGKKVCGGLWRKCAPTSAAQIHIYRLILYRRDDKSAVGSLNILETFMTAIPKPLIPQRADPFIHKNTDGYYYFTASVPAYDGIELRRSRTLEGLADAKTKNGVVETRNRSLFGINLGS